MFPQTTQGSMSVDGDWLFWPASPSERPREATAPDADGLYWLAWREGTFAEADSIFSFVWHPEWSRLTAVSTSWWTAAEGAVDACGMSMRGEGGGVVLS